jgi:hypothetical protein
MKYLIVGVLLVVSWASQAQEPFLIFENRGGQTIQGKLNPNALRSSNITVTAPDGEKLFITKVAQLGNTWVGTVDGYAGSQVVITGNTAIISYDKLLEYRPRGDYILGEFQEGGEEAHVEWDYVTMQDTGPIQSVYIYYSTNFLNHYGSRASAENAIANAVALANQGYINSGIPLTLELLGTKAVDYSDSGNLVTDLQNLTRFDHTEASILGADLYHLFVNSGSYCGVAYLGGSHGVTRRSCIGQHTFAHEIGHNQGAGHNVEDGTGSTSYAHGYRYCDSGGFRTIMSYSCGTPRINYFSSPLVMVNGRPTGVADSADNARRLRETAQPIANRNSPTNSIEGTLSNLEDRIRGNKAALSWSNSTSNGKWLEVYRDGAIVARLSPSTDRYTDSTVWARYRIRVYNELYEVFSEELLLTNTKKSGPKNRRN